jgi:hypothetical protein
MRTDSEVEDFNRRQVFVRDACPSSWLELGEELRDAAEEVWKSAFAGAKSGGGPGYRTIASRVADEASAVPSLHAPGGIRDRKRFERINRRRRPVAHFGWIAERSIKES